jgi:hypothetical protein
LAGYPGAENTPDVQTEIKVMPADSAWVLSGDLAKHVDDLLLVCEYTVAVKG